MTGTESRNDQSAQQRVVVGVDGSQQSVQALRWADRLAASTGSRLEAIIAWEYPMATGWGTTMMPFNYDLVADMEKVLIDAVDAAFGADRPAGLILTVREGHPARVLIECSAEALMLVVGSRGHGGFAGLLLGSISANVAEHAHCPVLVVHGDELAG